jgi:hypothetical protein
LVHHRLVYVLPGEESGDRSENGETRGAQGRPRNPCFAAVFGAVMELLLQMLERNFRFFHRRTLELRVIDSRRHRQVAEQPLNSAAKFR